MDKNTLHLVTHIGGLGFVFAIGESQARMSYDDFRKICEECRVKEQEGTTLNEALGLKK